jgi:hypothetical protein
MPFDRMRYNIVLYSRLCNIANDDPLRTPQKKNGTLSLDTYQQPDTDRERTPQMSIKRSRPEEVSNMT